MGCLDLFVFCPHLLLSRLQAVPVDISPLQQPVKRPESLRYEFASQVLVPVITIFGHDSRIIRVTKLDPHRKFHVCIKQIGVRRKKSSTFSLEISLDGINDYWLSITGTS